MRRPRLLSIFGTRPEAIKMAPLARALRENDAYDARVCISAQHREMLDQVLEAFALQPDYDLNLMQSGQGLGELAGRLLQALDPVLESFQPDMILVHGDTSTTAFAALAAYYRRIPVAHVEAGLRTHDKYQPWPEEINRRIAGVISDLHFAPTEQARANLLAENVADAQILVTGNTVIDALMAITERLRQSELASAQAARFPFLDARKKLLLVTGHRRENFGAGFDSICEALLALAQANPQLQICYPVHLNPRVREPVHRLLGQAPREVQRRIHLIEPVDYVGFCYLMGQAYIILTDSGGVQEEAPSLGKPVLVMRNTTERPEAIAAGTARLVGTDEQVIRDAVQQLIDDPVAYQRVAAVQNPYGDGHAVGRILARLAEHFSAASALRGPDGRDLA